ncbi:TRANS-1,2-DIHYDROBENZENE-1,2-DIOL DEHYDROGENASE / D-xylose 1-dehydrogenase (NADP+) [Bacillus thuringiensis serovar israelensis ATCC 35646]|nr:TRANS-1,2-DIHYDROBENZENE-1,2-DIOL DEHYDROGENASE / D-xylose 1-dehydrogenase (NADP+) [Bacillus thuringiensis serovar israelensis ATCC 35646]
MDELLNDKEIQVVTVCTPAHTHYELAKKVILAGKSVIVEKPFCDTVEHAKEIISFRTRKRCSSYALSKPPF